MIRPPKDDKERIASEAFKDLKPFTIVINRPDDAMWLSMAMFNEMTRDKDLAMEALHHMIGHAKTVGVEASVNEFFNQATESEVSYPDFLKPLMVLMLTHLFENKDMISGLVKKLKENE